MRFLLTDWWTSPFMLMFLAVFTGLILGNIKIGRFKFGVSGTLFSGLIIGYFVYDHALGLAETHPAYQQAQEMLASRVVPQGFFTLFLILFVAAVGLLASEDIVLVVKKYGAKFILLGLIVTLAGMLTAYGMTFVIAEADRYEMGGVYTGAMTSSPGLGAAIEAATDHAERRAERFAELSPSERERILIKINSQEYSPEETESLSQEQQQQYIAYSDGGVGLGYAVAYPFGVMAVILAVNFLPVLFKIDVKKEKELFHQEMAEARRNNGNGKEIDPVNFDIMAFGLVALLGYTLGAVQLNLGPLGYVGLGSTGSVLIVSLLLGSLGQLGPLTFRMHHRVLGMIREFSLAFFLAVIGLRYGHDVGTAILGRGPILAVSSVVVAFISILVGYFAGRKIFKLNWVLLSGGICGGMTSTPGLGATIDALDDDSAAAGYGAVYPFALLTMVLFTIILYLLPM